MMYLLALLSRHAWHGLIRHGRYERRRRSLTADVKVTGLPRIVNKDASCNFG